MPNPYQLAAQAIDNLVNLRTSFPPDVSRTMGSLGAGSPPVPAPGTVTRQGTAAGNVLKQIFDSILFGSSKPPVRVVTIDPLAGATFVQGSVVTPDSFTNVQQTLRGVTLAVDDAVLINGQASQVQNGHYTVTAVSGGFATIQRSVGCQNGDLSFAGTQVWDAENKVLYYLDCVNDLFLFTIGTDPLHWRVLDVLNVAGTKTPARVATTADLAATYDGTEVQGFTNAPANIDGIALADGDRVLVKNQATASENGVYDVLDAVGGTWERSPDCRGDVEGGTLIFVQEGTANAETLFAISEDGVLRFGTDGITFTPYPTSSGISAENAGVPIAGGPFSTINLVTGLTGADGGGGTLDVSAGGGDCVINEDSRAAGGGTSISVLAGDFVVGAVQQDVVRINFTGITGNMTLALPADPGGAGAFKVGALLELQLDILSTDRTLDGSGNSSGLSRIFHVPIQTPGAPTAPVRWHFLIQYCGSDEWQLQGQHISEPPPF